MGNKTRAMKFLMAASVLLLFLAPFASAAGACSESQLGSVAYDSGRCLNRGFNNQQGSGYSACYHYLSQSACEIDCRGCQWEAEGGGGACWPLQPPAGDASTHDCSIWNDNEAACTARSASTYVAPYYGCLWAPGSWHGGGASCSVPAGGLGCTGNYEPNPPNSNCCVQAAPYCINDPNNPGTMVCAACIPEGSPTQCAGSGNGNCCQTPHAQVCDATLHVCVPPVNHPPADPLPSQIAAYPSNSIFYSTTGQAACTLNCPPNPMPSDPDPGDTVRMQYRWVRQRAGQPDYFTGWSADTPGIFSCGSACMAGDAVILQSQAFDSRATPAYSSIVPSSNSLTAVEPPPPAPIQACSAEFSGTLQLCAIAGVAMAALIALTYMFGEFFQNPKMLTWAKTEAMQLFVSLVIATVVIWAVGTFCTVQAVELKGMLNNNLPVLYSAHPDLTLYSAGINYLENLAGMALANVASIRYNLGAYEIRTTFTEYKCDGICLFTMSSTNEAAFGGETLNLAVTNNLLSTATISYFTAEFQYFTMLYIANGLFVSFLPLAIVIRSIPFMRQFGGALVGIIMALYILYPAMVVVDSYVAPGLAQATGATLYARDGISCGGHGEKVFSVMAGSPPSPQAYVTCLDSGAGLKQETELANSGTYRSDMTALAPSPLAASIKLNVLIFLASVFLPAINFIVIAALARDMTRFLGEEADISRLGQMV
ncbi:Uncharacterised protein [uncultured archaeon]|nr:Uncharacterised protein [uncultured archaeon]